MARKLKIGDVYKYTSQRRARREGAIPRLKTGPWIRDRRKMLGMSAVEVLGEIDMNQGQFSDMEHGFVALPEDYVNDCARVLRANVTFLLALVRADQAESKRYRYGKPIKRKEA